MSQDYLNEMRELYKRMIEGEKKVFSRIICPHTYDSQTTKNRCVLCELCKAIIFDRSIPKDDPKKILAKNYSAKTRYYSNILVMTNPDEVLLFEYGEVILKKLLTMQLDELSEYKDFMHPVNGRNLFIIRIKTGTEIRNVDYDIQPRVSTSQIPNMQVLKNLYNLDDIPALIMANKVKLLKQTQLQFQRTEIRILPNGNPNKPLLFFKGILYHNGLTDNEFEAIQKGQYNPILGTYNVQPKQSSSDFSTTYESHPIKKQADELSSDILKEIGLSNSSQSDLGDFYVNEENNSGVPSEYDDSNLPPDVDETINEPICFGGYSKDNPICQNECQKTGWGEACKKVYESKLSLRQRAKKINP